jgi:hypothetical protein
MSFKSIAKCLPPPVLVEWQACRVKYDHLALTRHQDLRGPEKPFYSVPSDMLNTGMCWNAPIPPSEQGFGSLLGLWTKVGCFKKVDDEVVQGRELIPLVLLRPIRCLG